MSVFWSFVAGVIVGAVAAAFVGAVAAVSGALAGVKEAIRRVSAGRGL